MCINTAQIIDSFISISTLGLHWHLLGVNRCLSLVSNSAAETFCSYSPRSRQEHTSHAPPSPRLGKKGERFVNKSLFFGLCKTCLWAFLQSKQCNHFILYEGQLQCAGEEGWQILLNICSMRTEYVRCAGYRCHEYTSCSVYTEKRTINQTFCPI